LQTRIGMSASPSLYTTTTKKRKRTTPEMYDLDKCVYERRLDLFSKGLERGVFCLPDTWSRVIHSDWSDGLAYLLAHADQSTPDWLVDDPNLVNDLVDLDRVHLLGMILASNASLIDQPCVFDRALLEEATLIVWYLLSRGLQNQRAEALPWTVAEHLLPAARVGDVDVVTYFLNCPTLLGNPSIVLEHTESPKVMRACLAHPRISVDPTSNRVLMAAIRTGQCDLIHEVLADPRVDPSLPHNQPLHRLLRQWTTKRRAAARSKQPALLQQDVADIEGVLERMMSSARVQRTPLPLLARELSPRLWYQLARLSVHQLRAVDDCPPESAAYLKATQEALQAQGDEVPDRTTDEVGGETMRLPTDLIHSLIWTHLVGPAYD
jgi:hypothetical protein